MGRKAKQELVKNVARLAGKVGANIISKRKKQIKNLLTNKVAEKVIQASKTPLAKKIAKVNKGALMTGNLRTWEVKPRDRKKAGALLQNVATKVMKGDTKSVSQDIKKVAQKGIRQVVQKSMEQVAQKGMRRAKEKIQRVAKDVAHVDNVKGALMRRVKASAFYPVTLDDVRLSRVRHQNNTHSAAKEKTAPYSILSGHHKVMSVLPTFEKQFLPELLTSGIASKIHRGANARNGMNAMKQTLNELDPSVRSGGGSSVLKDALGMNAMWA